MSPRHTIIDSPLDDLTVVADGDALTGLYFRHHWYRPALDSFGPRADDGFEEVSRQLKEYFAGERTEFELPLRADGDDFQRSVWAEIARIPYGATVTYGEMAAALGDPSLARDVGAAVGRNPLSILVACHRVVGKDGKLTGYAGGLKRKEFLLELEKPSNRLW